VVNQQIPIGFSKSVTGKTTMPYYDSKEAQLNSTLLKNGFIKLRAETKYISRFILFTLHCLSKNNWNYNLFW
jgi:hypothetical protein